MELFRALGSLIEVPAPEHQRVAGALGLPAAPSPAVHGTVVGFQRYPYASVYLGTAGMMGGEARDRIAGFRRALGLERGGEEGGGAGAAWSVGADPGHRGARGPGEEDHLASLLALLAALEQWHGEEKDDARRALLAQARVTLVWEYLASWTGPYLASFDGCGAPFYAAWATLLGEALERLTSEMEFPGYLPAALRDAPALTDPRREGGAAFIAALLAPVRSGVIVLREDLVRLAEEVGLACRAGERRYVLNSFFAQDPGGTLEWLASHARGWGTRVAGRGPKPIARWWAGRAGETARLLSELAEGVAAQPFGDADHRPAPARAVP